MKNYTLILLSSLWLGIPANGLGQGAMLIQHTGAADPTSEGFSFGGSGQGGAVTNDLGVNAWGTSSGVSSVSYYYLFPSIAGLDWTLTGTLRIVTPGTPAGMFDLGITTGNITTGAEDFDLKFGSQANGDPTIEVVGSSLSPVLTLNGVGSTYNTYQLLYNAESDTASLWINGAEQLDNIYGGTYFQLPPSPQIYWASGNQGPPVTANWNLVSLSIPEPSSATFLLLGGGVLFYVRKRKRFRL